MKTGINKTVTIAKIINVAKIGETALLLVKHPFVALTLKLIFLFIFIRLRCSISSIVKREYVNIF
jgi:hypothetical protein